MALKPFSGASPGEIAIAQEICIIASFVVADQIRAILQKKRDALCHQSLCLVVAKETADFWDARLQPGGTFLGIEHRCCQS